MNRFIRTAFCLSLMGLLAPVTNAQVKQTSDLFPSATVAYLEVAGTKLLAKEIAALTKGSFLDEYPASLEAFRPKMKRPRYYMFNEMAYISAFLTSHALDEFAKFDGGAVAITQMDDSGKGIPHIIGVLRTGDSNLLHVSMRMMMLNLKPIAKVEGVWMFQEERRIYRDDRFGPGGKQPPPQARLSGPVVAMPDGAIILASHKDDVADVIRRLKGKGKGPSLTANKDFMQATQVRPAGGLFAYADMKTMMQLPGMLGNLFYGGHHSHKTFENVKPEVKEAEDEAKPKNECGFQPNQKRRMSGTEDLIRSFSSLGRFALGVSLDGGTLKIDGRINTDPKNPSGWSNFFTKRTLNRDLLHYVPSGRSAVFAFAMPDGSAFWDKLDKTAPVFETDISFTLGARVLDIAQFVAVAPDHKPNTSALYVVEAVNAQKARGLADTLSKVFRATAVVDGAVIVLSSDAKVAKEALAMGQAKKGMLASPPIASATAKLGEQHVALLTSIGGLLEDVMRSTTPNRNDFDKKADFVPGVFPPNGVLPQNPNRAPDKRYAKFADQMAKAWAGVSPMVISLGKSGHNFELQGSQTGLKTATAKCLDVWMHYYTHWTAMRRYGFSAVDDAIGEESTPAPPQIEKK